MIDSCVLFGIVSLPCFCCVLPQCRIRHERLQNFKHALHRLPLSHLFEEIRAIKIILSPHTEQEQCELRETHKPDHRIRLQPHAQIA